MTEAAQQSQIHTLNELLKGEQMAMRIYDKNKNLQHDSQVAEMLSRFAQDHARHAEQLKQRILALGGNPDEKLGAPGFMANIAAVINSLRGPKHLLKQIYDGEDKGIHAYEDRIDELDPGSQDMIRQIMNEDHEHLQWFKSRMEKEKSELH